MSQNCFRNLVLLALLLAVVSSLSIPSNGRRLQNQHMLRIHKTAYRRSHQQEADGAEFVAQTQSAIDGIQDSIDNYQRSIIQTKSLAAFNYSRATCESLEQDDKDRLTEKAGDTRKDIATFLDGLQNQKKARADAKSADKYLNTLQNLLAQQCWDVESVLIGPTPYQTNINTGLPWVLGGITFSDLVKDYLKRIEQNDNVTNCGEQTPFFTGQACVFCYDPTPVFNISSSECSKCPEDLRYNKQTKNCTVKGQFRPNGYAGTKNVVYDPLAPQGVKEDYQNQEGEECPQDKPYPADGECIACSGDKWAYSPEQLKCVRPVRPNWNANDDIVLGDGQPKEDIDKYMQQEGDQCPEDKPFVKDFECISCPEDKAYFNIEEKKCVKAMKPHSAGKENAMLGPGQTQEDLDDYMNQNGDECPQETPYVANNQCIACPEETPYFSIVEEKCKDCETFEKQEHTCAGPKRPHSSARPNVVVNNQNTTQADLNEYLSQEGEDCPEEKPFASKNKCIQCPEDKPFYDLDSEECIDCDGGQVNQETNQCQQIYPNATNTDKYKSSLMIDEDDIEDNSTSPDKVWSDYEEENSDSVYCRDPTPYWNGNQCIQCQVYFNIITKKCGQCSDQSLVLNEDSHVCEPIAPREPQLLDLFNSIF